MKARLVTLLAFALAGPPATAPGSPTGVSVPVPDPSPVAVHGMTISCQGWGWEWGTDDMVDAMRQLKGLGINWIAIHPYAGIRREGTVVMSARWYQDTTWLTRPIAEAHRLGLKIMIKPHLAYWGSPFKWRGEISFETEEQWRRFFETYETWITRVAALSAAADAFVIGTELDRTIHRAREWRRIIAAARRRLAPETPVTYSANWTDYERVPFWDALDLISIQAYFPLAERPGLPELADLEESWAKRMKMLKRFARDHDRRILFAELGYCRSPMAAVEPWNGREGGEHAEETQRRCLIAAMKAIDESDHVVGAFLWKWFPRRTRRANFLMSMPAPRRVIAEHWATD